MLFSQIVNLKVIFQLNFFLLTQLASYSRKMNEIFRTCTDLHAGKRVSGIFFHLIPSSNFMTKNGKI